MKLVYGDALVLYKGFTYLAVTTNGFVKRNGSAVMGAGIAKQVANKRPDVPVKLGRLLRENGNVVQKVLPNLIAFPVKHNWYEQADIKLIERSCHQLMAMLKPDETVLLNRPGVGNGKLNWTEVKSVIEKILDDRVYVVTFKEE